MHLPVAVATALAGVASAEDPSVASRPVRKRSHTKHQSAKANDNEAFDPFLGLGGVGRQVKTKGQPRRDLLGEDYCTWGFDYECYTYGEPACCFEVDLECPEERPPCDGDVAMSMSMPGAIAGESYCTWSPEYTCYADGWPECCGSDEECPEERPGCDIDGASYCTYSPDKLCYADGWPACCGSDEECPMEQPPCEITTTTISPPEVGDYYCTWGFDYDCYAQGKPACCFDDSVECPEESARVRCCTGSDAAPDCIIFFLRCGDRTVRGGWVGGGG